jgi:anaerobic ribonucleoside-triphosphate reductase activating protein
MGYDLWIYTGYLWEELDAEKKALAVLSDVVADGLYEAAQRSLMLKWRGSANQRLISVKNSLAEGKAVLWE